jgi:hypothetical protein
MILRVFKRTSLCSHSPDFVLEVTAQSYEPQAFIFDFPRSHVATPVCSVWRLEKWWVGHSGEQTLKRKNTKLVAFPSIEIESLTCAVIGGSRVRA